MSDLITRLRATSPVDTWSSDHYLRQHEAADEIERLRVKLLDYDNQWSRVAKAIEGDATDSPDVATARRLEMVIKRLRAPCAFHPNCGCVYCRNRRREPAD
jgi:hypothetical protein